jgi:uncharacterized membrane protein YbhN (UPF0104 family)
VASLATDWRKSLFDIAKAAVAIIAVGFLAATVLEQATTIRLLIVQIDAWYLLLALIALVAAFLLFPIPSLLFLRTKKSTLSYFSNGRAFFTSQLTKYLPGSLWVYPTRALLIKNAGFSIGSASLALLFESGAFITTAFAVSLTSIATFPPPYRDWALWVGMLGALGLVGLALILIAPAPLQAWMSTRRKKKVLLPKRTTMSFGLVLGTLAGTLLGLGTSWLLSGISLFLLLESVGAPVSASDIPFLAAIFSFAWAAGFIVVISPGGIGVRDVILAALLGTTYLAPIATLTILLSRILWTICELVLYALFTLHPE